MSAPKVKFVTLLESDLEKVVMAGPLSKRTYFALHIKGPYGARQIDYLIRMLQMQRDWLGEDESAATTDDAAQESADT